MSVEDAVPALCRLPSERDAELECRFNRNSSLADGLLDRWIWAPYLGVDEGAKICDGAFTRLLHKAWHVVVTRTPTFRVASASQNRPCSTRLCHDYRPVAWVAYPHQR